MKIKTPTVAAILLCALSTGGQTPSPKPSPQRNWRMPDGRIVMFPASTNKEEIDALAKRIAEGAVELPPGARVIGWEPVKEAVSLPLYYEQRIATIPTVKGKLDALANAAGILQSQINALEMQLGAERAGNHAGFKSTDETLNNHAANIAALAGDVTHLTQQAQMEKYNWEQELNDFKDGACPLLRTLRMDEITRTKLDSACGLH